MITNERDVFISYCQKDSIPKQNIITTFKLIGIIPTIDEFCLEYTESIHEFMNSIVEYKIVVLIITKEYLSSINCMYEFVTIMNNVNWKDKVLPIVIDSEIYSLDFKEKCVEYWENEYNNNKSKFESLSKNIRDIYALNQKKLDVILSSLGTALTNITDLKCVKLEEAEIAIKKKLNEHNIEFRDIYSEHLIEFNSKKDEIISESQFKFIPQNELINACFINTINQRGKKTYNGFCLFDGWFKSTDDSDGSSTVSINDKSITFEYYPKLGSVGDYRMIRQSIQYPARFSSKKMTLSAEILNIENEVFLELHYSVKNDKKIKTYSEQILKVGISHFTINLEQDISYLAVSIKIGINSLVEIQRIKLEENDLSTLDISAIPNYYDELFKCQRFIAKISKGTRFYPIYEDDYCLHFQIPLPTQLHALPTIRFNDFVLIKCNFEDEVIYDVNFFVYQMIGNFLYIACKKEENGKNYKLVVLNDTVIDASLL